MPERKSALDWLLDASDCLDGEHGSWWQKRCERAYESSPVESGVVTGPVEAPLRQRLVKYLSEQFPNARLADHQFGADSLLSIFTKADPLRVLLADKQRAVDVLCATIWNANPERVTESGPWDRQGPAVRRAVQVEADAVLAALREVANGG